MSWQVLSWKVHLALLNAKLEPYLGSLHGIQFSKPSSICDFLELYRSLMDDFVLGYARELSPSDFVLKDEGFSKTRKGKRQYLNEELQREFFKNLNLYFQKEVKIPRIRVGQKQEIETLINEEALLLAKFLRNESETWIPRINA